jgi:hypothetical protein
MRRQYAELDRILRGASVSNAPRMIILGKGEMSKDGVSWEADLSLTYRRAEQR